MRYIGTRHFPDILKPITSFSFRMPAFYLCPLSHSDAVTYSLSLFKQFCYLLFYFPRYFPNSLRFLARVQCGPTYNTAGSANRSKEKWDESRVGPKNAVMLKDHHQSLKVERQHRRHVFCPIPMLKRKTRVTRTAQTVEKVPAIPSWCALPGKMIPWIHGTGRY